MTSVGAALRSAREKQGRSASDVADEICITQRYLRAIEQDKVEELPGTFFYKSFVKQYAAILGLDYGKLRSGVQALTASAEEPESPLPVHDDAVNATNHRYVAEPRTGIAIVGLVVMLVAGSAVYTKLYKPSQSTVKPAAAAVAPPSEAPAPVAVSGEPVLADATNSQSEEQVVLNVSATEKTWLSITSGGKQVFSGVLQPSETKTVSGLEMARLKVGNAGGVEVEWNGQAIGPIGPRGQVRVVVFTPENFEILPTDPSQSGESL
jgi:cytoskeleton protein RodZ